MSQLTARRGARKGRSDGPAATEVEDYNVGNDKPVTTAEQLQSTPRGTPLYAPASTDKKPSGLQAGIDSLRALFARAPVGFLFIVAASFFTRFWQVRRDVATCEKRC